MLALLFYKDDIDCITGDIDENFANFVSTFNLRLTLAYLVDASFIS